MTEEENSSVSGKSYNQYEIYLTQLYNWLFPPLLHKLLKFYIWYFVEKEPEEIFSKNDILEIMNILIERDIKEFDELVTAIQSFPIADAVVVRKAILYRINKLENGEDGLIIIPNNDLDIVMECLQVLLKQYSEA